MGDIRAEWCRLPLRSALSAKDARFVVGGPSTILFQCGNCIIHYNHKDQVQRAIQFPPGICLDSWDINLPRGLISFAIRGNSKSLIQLYDLDSLLFLHEFDQKKDEGHIYGQVTFSRCGFRMLTAETFPGCRVDLWYLGREPAKGEIDDKKFETRVLKTIQASSHELLQGMSFNPSNQDEFIVFTTRAITKYICCLHHSVDMNSSEILYDLQLQPKDKEFLHAYTCHTWGPDNIVYCGLKNGKVVGLRKDSNSIEVQASGNNEKKKLDSRTIKPASSKDHLELFQKRPTELLEVMNMLKFHMAEPATGLYSELDIRANFIPEETSSEHSSSNSSWSEPSEKHVIYRSEDDAGISSLSVCGSHLLVASLDKRIAIFDFLQTKKGSTVEVILSQLKGKLNYTKKDEILVSMICDEKAGDLLTVSHDGTLHVCPLEVLKKQCSALDGSEGVAQNLSLSRIQHFLPTSIEDTPVRNLLRAINVTSSTLLLSNNRCLLANQDGLLRIINHHQILSEYQLSAALLPPMDTDTLILAMELENDKSGTRFEQGRLPTLSSHVDVSNDRNLVAVGCANGVVTVCDCKKNDIRPVFSVRLHTVPVEAVVFSTDSSMLASVGVDGSVVITSMTLQRPIKRFEASETTAALQTNLKKAQKAYFPLCARWVASGKLVVGFEFGTLATFNCHANGDESAIVSSDLGIECCEILHGKGLAKTHFLAVLKNKTIALFSTERDTIELVQAGQSLGFVPTCATMSPDSSVIAIGGEDGQLSIQMMIGDQNTVTAQAHDPLPLALTKPDIDCRTLEFGVNSVVFSKYGPTLLSFGSSSGCFVWDLRDVIPKSIDWWTQVLKAEDAKTLIREKAKKAKEEAEAKKKAMKGIKEVEALVAEKQDMLYCPLSMGAVPCKEKLEDGVCVECGLNTVKDSKADGHAFEIEEPIAYCPLSLGGPLCTKHCEDGVCTQCGVEVPIKAAPNKVAIPTEEKEEGWMPTVPEAKGTDMVDLKVIGEEEAGGERVGPGGGQALREKLGELSKTLKGLLDANNKVDDIERLPREEFIIDTEMQEMLQKKGEEDADRERKTILRKNKARELEVFRITEQTREAFATERLLIEPFKAPIHPVSNYPVVALTSEKIDTGRKIEYLRKMQIMELRFVAAQLDEEIDATTKGSPAVSPVVSPLGSPTGAGGMSGFTSDVDYTIDAGWPASMTEWETIGVLHEEPLTIAAKYVIDVNESRLLEEETLLEKAMKAIGKPKEIERHEEGKEGEEKKKNKKSKQKGKEEEENKVDWRTLTLGTIPDSDPQFSLQHPVLCCTRQRKVIQVHALMERSRKLASRYNRVFDKYYREKQSCHEQVLEKTRRIMDVREELRALKAKCALDQKEVDDRREQLQGWKDKVEEEKYLHDVKRARIMGKKVPVRRVKGSSQAEKAEAKKRAEELAKRQKEEADEEAELTRVIFATRLTEDEIPAKLYSVQDDEIKVSRPLNAEEKRRAAELAARSGGSGGNAHQRALKEMMGGVLKRQGVQVAEDEVLEKEDWMIELPPHQMTKEQKLKLKAVEKREQAIRDERLAQRRDTLRHLKKLNEEIHTLLDKYDVKLRELAQCRFHLDKILERHNYLAACLLSDTSALDIGELTIEAMIVRLGQLRAGHKKRARAIQTTQKKVEELRQTLTLCQSQDAKEVKLFRKEFERFDIFDTLNSIYKKRVRRKKAVAVRPAIFPPCDFKEEETIIVQAQTVDDWLDRLQSLEQVAEKERGLKTVEIEGIQVSAKMLGEMNPKPGELEMEENFVERFTKLRIRKIFAEQKEAVATRILGAWEKKLKLLEDEETAVKNETERIHAHMKRWNCERLEQGMDNHITLRVDQGFVEAVDASPMSGLSSWIVYDRDLVEAFNNAILQRGESNMESLHSIVSKYCQLRHLMWKGHKLTLEHAMAEADTREIQLLRVTKKLQETIKSGGSGQRLKEQVELLKRKILWNERMFNKKIGEREKVMSKIKRDQRSFASRNKKLESSLRELHEHVAKLQKIRGQRVEAPRQPEQKRKNSSANLANALSQVRKLGNIAQIQREDIVVLRRERDRLQRKSFPMFDQAFDSRGAASPDVTFPMPSSNVKGKRGLKKGRAGRPLDQSESNLKLPAIK